MSGKGGIGGRTTYPTRDRSEGAMVSISQLPGNKQGLDVKTVSHGYIVASDTVDSYNAASYTITAASHSAKAGDIVRMTSGSAQYLEFNVYSVTANTIVLGNDPETDPAGTDTFDILRPLTPTVTSTGGITNVVTYVRNGSNQQVIEDTVTPANNRPLPVKLTDFSGDMILNASNLNLQVQLDHNSANPDSVQVGDGTEILLINASGEAQVSDDTARTHLATIAGDTTSLDTKLPAQGAALIAASTPVNIASDQTVPVSAASLPLPTGAATSANQSTIITAVQAIQTAVELLDNAVSGSELQVDVVAALPTGSNTIGKVDVNPKDVVDFIDTTPLLDTSSTNIPASASTPVTIVASLAANVTKVQLLDTTGAFIGLYSDPAGSPVLEAIFGPGSDQTVEVAISSGTVLGLRNMENSTISTGLVAINFMG